MLRIVEIISLNSLLVANSKINIDSGFDFLDFVIILMLNTSHIYIQEICIKEYLAFKSSYDKAAAHIV